MVLIVLVVSLSLVPCCVPTLKSVASTVLSPSETCCDSHSDEHDDDKQSCESCSPFFTCGTCGGFISHYTSVNFKSPITWVQKTYSPFKIQFYSDFFIKKWQPPKIV